MKLLKTLAESISDTMIILEYSEKLKGQLLTKFKQETKDDDVKIMALITSFEKFKDSLPASERDITKYPYLKLKNVVANRQRKQEVDSLMTTIKKKEKGIETSDLKKVLNRFLDIKSELPRKGKEIEIMSYLDLVKLVKDNYKKLITKILSEKFKKEKPDLTEQILLFYIQSYFDIESQLPENTKRPVYMGFDEFEHLIDAELAKTQSKQKDESDFSGIDIVYEGNNMLIFNAKTKDQCIRLKHGRSWCIGREGGSNLFYNYRLSNERTIYYVLDQDKPFSDLNFAVVILVDPYGGMALADGSNSGRYSGHGNIPWSEIVSKIPKLDGLKDVFKPMPLTDKEKELHRSYRGKRLGNDPIKEMGGEEQVEMWMEINSPDLTDEQYKNLTPKLQKKYLALGMTLSPSKIQSSSAEVLKYYISKQLSKIKSSSLSQLRDEDIALLNMNLMKKVKEELKTKFAESLIKTGTDALEATYPQSDMGKFIGLYGFDDLFVSVPDTIKQIMITNTNKDSNIAFDIPPSIGRFKNVTALLFSNIVKSIPDEIGDLKNLNFLSLPNNPQLTSLPESLSGCENMTLINLENTPAKLPESLKPKFGETDQDFYWGNQ